MDNFKNDRSVNINTLLSQFFKVADFQRDYVWEEDDIEQLINDITDSYNKNQPSYFLGAIVLTDNSNNFLIVDGQQRITTLTLIIAAIREKIRISSPDVYNYLTQFLSDKKMTSDGKVEDCPRLTFNDLKSDESIQYLINKPENLQAIDEGNDTANNIKSGFFFALEYLDKIQIPLTVFANYVIEKVVLLPYITNNLKQALIVFETLNSKGRSLTPIDLLKNALFSSEDESNWENLKVEWNKFKDSIDKIGESEKRFLKYYILVTHNQKIAENEVFDWIVEPKNTNMAENPFEFIDHIRTFAESYGYIMQNKGPDGIENKKIHNIRLLAEKGRQFFPLLISLRKLSSTNPLYDKILLSVESILISYSIMRAYTGAIENTFSDWTKKLNSSMSDEAIQSFIDADVTPEVKRLGKQAYEKLINLTERDISRKKLQYLLLRIDIYLSLQSGGAYRTVKEYSNFEIEHILPKKYDSTLVLNMSETEHTEAVTKLGNLTILEKPLNRAIKNSGIKQKIETYENSSFIICKASVSNISGNNTLAKSYAKVHKISVMDMDDINKRQKNIADLLSEIYGWDIHSLI